MKKRWGTLLLAGLLGTAVLSGCGSSASDSALLLPQIPLLQKPPLLLKIRKKI